MKTSQAIEDFKNSIHGERHETLILNVLLCLERDIEKNKKDNEKDRELLRTHIELIEFLGDEIRKDGKYEFCKKLKCYWFNGKICQRFQEECIYKKSYRDGVMDGNIKL